MGNICRSTVPEKMKLLYIALSLKTYFWNLFHIHFYIMLIFPTKYKYHEVKKEQTIYKIQVNNVFMETAKFTTLQMYSSLIFSGTVDRQILPTMHHGSEFPISLIMKISSVYGSPF